MKSGTKYEVGNMPKFIDFVGQYFKLDDYGMTNLRRALNAEFPQLADKSKCPNCGESMMAYKPRLSRTTAVALIRIAKEVRRRVLEDGLAFHEANDIYISRLATLNYGEKSSQTNMAKLGLIAKVLRSDGKQKWGHWLVTKRGWELLRGGSVPAEVKVFRGQIIERYEEGTITLADAMSRTPSGKIHPEGGYDYSPADFVGIESAESQAKMF